MTVGGAAVRLHAAGGDSSFTAVLLDPDDDAALTHELLHRHDPAGGVVVVHPTPGTRATAAFGHDLLAALGHPINRLGEERLTSPTRAWHAVQAWMLTDATAVLVVLRADRLTAPTWQRILDLRTTTDTRLLLVCHTGRIPAGLRGVLISTDHRVLPHLPPALHAVPPLVARRIAPQVADELPALPARGVAHYRAEAYRRLDPDAFDRFDAVYRYGFAHASTWLGGPTARALPSAEGEQAALFLIGLVQDSPTRTHTLARIRGAQAAFLAHGHLLTVSDTNGMLHRLHGPGLDTAPFTEATAARIRAGVASPVVAAYLAAVLSTGLDPAALRPASVIGGPENPHTLRVPWRPPRDPRGPAGPARHAVAFFPVPEAARPLLRAAALFSAATTAGASVRLLCPRASTTPHRIVAAAANCGITLPAQAGDVADCWPAWVTCRRLPAPPVLPPGAGERWMLAWGSRHYDWAGEVWSELQVPADRDGHFARSPLTAAAAAALLHLIHRHRHGLPRGFSGASWLLLRRQLAHYPPDSTGAAGVLTPHPDVLFALDLAEEPDLGPEGAAFSDHNDR